MPSYKSFCWALGTTSFRTENFNKTIEEQLALLDEFWSLPENKKDNWEANNELQARYYDFMKSKEFVVGNANNKPKDAREKTSGLVDIGLITPGRKLTEAGSALLEISKSNDFTTDNFFQIPKDSYVYLKQLLKTANEFDDGHVRPFIVLIHALSKYNELSLDEFTYLIPLATDEENTKQIIDGIQKVRNGESSIDDIIISRLMSMDNYKEALEILTSGKVSEELICDIGLNRKSRSYDKAYYPLYCCLYEAFVNGNKSALFDAFMATKPITIGKWWRSYLFNTVSETAISKNPLACTKATIFNHVKNESDFKIAFFKTMHLFKAKATLSDYFDLNRRYFKTTDIFLFEDDTVKLDIIPKHFFASIEKDLYNEAYTQSPVLVTNCEMDCISKCRSIGESTIIKAVNDELGTAITTISEAQNVLEDRRYARLQHLIDTKFTDSQLLSLLDLFESRNDVEIRRMVTDNADVPTIFEYVLGILWYKASERCGKILDYMKLSLDADLLPKTHAAGGEADIVYEYESNGIYPDHTLLLEATLADGTNQRRMEMEPVSRHLGQHRLNSKNENSYCVFSTTYLDINVLSDFISRKNYYFYNTRDYSEYITGMKIIPLQTSELKKIITSKKTYNDLFPIFESAYKSNLPPHKWYSECIQKYLG